MSLISLLIWVKGLRSKDFGQKTSLANEVVGISAKFPDYRHITQSIVITKPRLRLSVRYTAKSGQRLETKNNNLME
jgi:hypothetical protein